MPAAALETGFILGMGAACFLSIFDSETVLENYDIWVNGKRQSYRSVPCEESICREELVYKHLRSHPRILRRHGLVEVHLEPTPLGNVRQHIEDHAEQPFPERTRLEMVLDVSVGLSYTHSRTLSSAAATCPSSTVPG
ncbi:hypothetical protein NKR19_g2762 [Coniochaeta hoffmannii]|uniref:Uncharacterized protein n=1 Tax=Coniochaeta hoffmannii TaxID=91930 RepID=A0AA38SG14_9PEZI|nr:hypothetical protein NKR19_g2762 [Coniochaeta hoffmannii]